jgi:hypothetical protein
MKSLIIIAMADMDECSLQTCRSQLTDLLVAIYRHAGRSKKFKYFIKRKIILNIISPKKIISAWKIWKIF